MADSTHSEPRFPQQPQRQDSLDDQLRDVVVLANRAGCYDAADYIQKVMDRKVWVIPAAREGFSVTDEEPEGSGPFGF